MPLIPSSLYATLRQLIDTDAHAAMEQAESALENYGPDATLLCLRGHAATKLSLWHEALRCYMAAQELDPESPAAEARAMIESILEFSAPDMYNP